MHLMSLMALKKSRKRSDFVIYSHLGDSAFSPIKKDALQPRPQGFSLKKMAVAALSRKT